MKYLLALAALAALQPALGDRAMEPNAFDEEKVVLISYQAADALLGEPDSTATSIDSLNQMPATAAGKSDVILISVEQAKVLLGGDP